jgi:hypothetical protein
MNLLWDSARKCIDVAEWFKKNNGITGWRKSKAWKREIKKQFRVSSKVSSTGGKNQDKRLHGVVTQYLQLCEKLADKVSVLLAQSITLSIPKHLELQYFYKMLVKHIDLVRRRILNGEVIPSSEKVYSIFETHAEWITKGKKFTPVDIGHNVLIATDQFNFIIYHQVYEKQTDAELTQSIATTLVNKFPCKINALSFDKGFYSKQNKEFVQELIPQTIMPKKGKRNKEETQQEHHPDFKKLRNAHSAVESNINQLMHNGLERCPDRGIKNYKRYTALSVLAYNIHKLGEHIYKKEKKVLKRAG